MRSRTIHVGAVILAGLLAALALAGPAHAVGTVTRTAVPFQAPGYSFKQVAWGAEAGFEAVGYIPSGWATGQAAFGIPGQCAFDNDGSIHTTWAANTDMLLRKEFTLPAFAHNLRVEGTVDNDATVYINGQQLGLPVLSGNCIANAINRSAPDSLLVAGGTNLLAVRGHDSGVTTYLDQRVLYDVPLYSLCLLYDPAKSHKSGSTVPLKLQLCDENGVNVSSADIVLHATGLTKTDNSASPAVEDSGDANPGDDFRYDATLGGTGGYIFNKSTKGLSAGTWKISFSVAGDEGPEYALFFDVR